MYATKRKEAEIVYYFLNEENYENYFLPIDTTRIKVFDIDYDEEWVNNTLLPRLSYLADCLKHRRYPEKR